MFFSAAPIDRKQRRSGAAVLICLVALLLGLGGRLVYINVALRGRLLSLAQQQRRSRSVIPAHRGTIFDARGRVMATSRQMPDVFVDPARVEDLGELARTLGSRVNLSAAEIVEKVNRRPDSRFVIIATEVDEVTAEAVRALGHPGVGLAERAVRTYPLGSSAAHVLGLVGRDGRGLEGLELAWDEHLAGVDGTRATVRDGRRRGLWTLEGSSAPPLDGGHLVLTIDAEIQRVVEEALADTVEEFEAESGVAVVISPRNGDVLAMACIPTYDPNRLEPGTENLRRNRVLTDPVEPGSTFKPFIACGALEGGFVSTTEQIDCKGGTYRIGRRTVTDVSPHGLMPVSGIVSKSSNIGMALIAARMGNEALYTTIRRFGFGDQSGIECPGESPGIVHPLERWNSYSTTSVSFGYEVGVTPLQLATAFAALANDGVLLKPRLVKSVLGPDGTVVSSFEGPEMVRRAVSSEVARYMTQEVLVSVVEEGSAVGARLARYRVFGKTGTAKLLFADRPGYEPQAYLSTFVGAAPAADAEVIALVMIRRPKPGGPYYGATVAAPAVGRILRETLAYLEIPPDRVSGLAGL